jgi:hypothetical protein
VALDKVCHTPLNLRVVLEKGIIVSLIEAPFLISPEAGSVCGRKDAILRAGDVT